MKVTIGSRASLLARRQAEMVEERLSQGLEVERKVFSTLGDTPRELPARRYEYTGIFTRELEEALLSGFIDIAVHSLKDVPTKLPDGLVLAAFLPRGDPRDALVSPHGSLNQLPRGAVVGTSSLRRRSQLMKYRSDFELKEMRGNVDTRIAKLDEGLFDAIVLAACGLERIGLAHRIVERIDASIMLPAACQGIIVVEARSEDADTIALARNINDEESQFIAEAERTFLESIEGGCRVPVGCLGVVNGEGMRIEGMIGDNTGISVRAVVSGALSDRVNLAKNLADKLLDQGGDAILTKFKREREA